jgi:hypothetical protein
MPKVEAAPAAAVARDPHWSQKMARLRAREPIRATVTVVLEEDLKGEVARADMELTAARARAERDSGTDAPTEAVTELEAKVAQLRARLEDNTIKLTFQGLPRDVYEALMADHPPTPDQEGKGEVWNTDTFPPALVAACSVDGMSLEDAQELMRGWNQSEAASLFQAASFVNTMSRVELGKG